MTQIEQIKAEIERLKDFFKTERKKTTTTDKGIVDKLSFSSKIVVLEELLVFINSLPDKKPSEDLEKAAKNFVEKNSPYTDEFMLDNEVEEAYKIAELTFKRGAQWQKEQTINKACEWLNKNVVEYHPWIDELRPIVNSNAFREAMEKEDEQ